MKFSLAIALLVSVLSTAGQQRASPDRIATDVGDLAIQPITHGTLVLSWQSETIYVDPYGGAERFKGLDKPSIILITDIHGDHLNLKTLEALDLSGAQMIVPQAVMDKLPEGMQEKATVVDNGVEIALREMGIEAIPMYNLPDDESSRHKKGRGNGYVLTIGGMRIYLSGDTEDIPEMRALKNIDVAFVCMNLPYTMDVDQAASAVNEFKPKVVYPYHYRGSGGLSDVKEFKTMVDGENSDIEVRLRDWYPGN